jgi:hypothetical protein
LAADPPNHVDTWKFDVLHLKNGATFRGLLEGETATVIRFCYIQRRVGERTCKISSVYTLDEIKGIDRLDDADRKRLRERMEKLSPASEKRRMESLKLKPAPWGKQGKGALSYMSEHFVLISNAREEIVRRAALRLEDIYAAYTNYLPPRRPTGKSTTILLVRSLAEYREMLKLQNRQLLNPAFYDPARNEIVWAGEFDELDAMLAQSQKNYKEDLERLKAEEMKVRKKHNGGLPQKEREPLDAARETITKALDANKKQIREATDRQFQILYHEAFHAYLANFVYPPKEAEVPRWLNEGLAQIFETAVVEAGELNVGPPDARRLAQAKQALHDDKLVPLEDLLTAGSREFLVNHANAQQVSDQYYLTSWALAYYLTFERKKLGTPELDRYVLALKEGSAALPAFCQLVGQSLPEFEKAFHKYLRARSLHGRAVLPRLKN